MDSCHCLSNIIRASDELWKLKFIKRWGNFIFQPPNNEKIWFEWTTLRWKKAEEVQKVVLSMSSIAYPLGESPIIVIKKLIMGPYPIPEFVQNELEEIISDKKITDNKTTAHYARDALVKVRISILDKKWRDFMAQPESQMSLFEGVTLISQWSTMGHGKEQTCVRDLEMFIQNIIERVEQLAFTMENVFETADPKKKAEQILDLIKEVMFSEMHFRILPFHFFALTTHYTCIAQVFESKQGCPTLLCAIFQEVARKMDLPCELVYCFKWNVLDEFMDSMLTTHQLLLRWKDSAGSDDDSIYIDVYRGRSFKQSRAYPSLKEQPPASVYSVLKRMIELLTECLQHCIEEPCDRMFYPEDWLKEWPEGWMRNELIFYLRLACSMSPENRDYVIRYAKSCIEWGIHLDDAAELVQSPELKLPNLFKLCIRDLNKQQAEITAAKTAHHRLPSVRFSVGLVAKFRFRKFGEIYEKPCVIVYWNLKFKESKEWITEGHDAEFDEYDQEVGGANAFNSITAKPLSIQDQTHYHILMVHGYDQHQLNVPEETLGLLSDAVAIKHDKIWIHFERFDGRRYVPNAEKRAQFPEDEAVTLSLIG